MCNSVAQNIADFADGLRAGVSGICKLDGMLGKMYEDTVWIGGEIRNYNFNNVVQNNTERVPDICRTALATARRSSLSVQTAITSALEAWLDADLDQADIDPHRIALVVVSQYTTGQHIIDGLKTFSEAPEYVSPRLALEYQETYALGVLSKVFGIRGEGFNVGGASASGNLALIKAAQLLALDSADVCLVCGVGTVLTELELQSFSNLGALGGRRFADRPEQASRPFDRQREGFIYGQGSGCIVLEQASSLRKRSAKPLARLAGACSCLSVEDGASPSLETEIFVMKEAVSTAGASLDNVGYVNAHGTSSQVGDDIEARALTELFASRRVLVNSTKSLIGHCLATAGLQEAMATIVQLNQGFRHKSANLEEPIRADIGLLDSLTFDDSRLALSNSFGFSGIHSSILFELE